MGDMDDAEAMQHLEEMRVHLVEEFKHASAKEVDEVIAKIQAIDRALGCLLRRKEG